MPQTTLEEHYPWIEKQREAKRAEYEARGETRDEREITGEVFRDIAQGATPPPPSAPLATPVPVDQKALELKEQEHHEVIRGLLEVTLTRDLASGMKLAARMHNPHIQDDFHDALVEQYEKLRESKKIIP